jgi:Transposase IS4
VIGTLKAQDMLNKHPHLTITTIGVLTLALNLPYKDYPFTIFIDNLFTTLPLFSTLRSYGIGACGTARTDQFLGHFTKETLKKNNSKML